MNYSYTFALMLAAALTTNPAVAGEGDVTITKTNDIFSLDAKFEFERFDTAFTFETKHGAPDTLSFGATSIEIGNVDATFTFDYDFDEDAYAFTANFAFGF